MTRTGSKSRNVDRPVLAVALDASDWGLIDRWMNDGTMPNLRRLRDQGVSGRLTSPVDWLAGSPWPSFCTGYEPPDHGLIFYLQWRPELMRHDRPRAEWLPIVPFYRRFGEAGRRVVAVDVPLAYEPDPIDGVEITSWGCHDKLGPTASYPAEVIDWVNREFGRMPLTIEISGEQDAPALLDLRDDLIRSAGLQAELCRALMAREAWDFFLVAIAATHRGGHKLWDQSIVRRMTEEQGEELGGALKEVYAASDRALGRILEAAGPDTTVLCFAVHGMGPNTSRFELAPEMLDRILLGSGAQTRPAQPEPSVLGRLREAIPVEWRSAAKQRFPEDLQDALSRFWRGVDRRDWSNTRAFTLLGDLQALVQINLRGREAQGIVEPGREYEELCDLITEGMMSFVDGDTGERVVRAVGRGSELFPEARHDVGLPDLVIRWNETPVQSHRRIVSARYGKIPWPHPGRPLGDRSGHHGTPGWLIGAGEGIPGGRRMETSSVFDLNATIHHLVGVPQPGDMLGTPIPALCAGSV